MSRKRITAVFSTARRPGRGRGGTGRAQHGRQTDQDHRLLPPPPRSTPATRCGWPGVRSARSPSIDPTAPGRNCPLAVKHGVPIPADAKAVIVASNLVGARYVQLTRPTGPTVTPADRENARRRGHRHRPHCRAVEVGRNQDSTVPLGSGSGARQRRFGLGRSGGFIDSAATALRTVTATNCARDHQAAVRPEPRPRRRQRQHRRHHQEPPDLRHRAARQQRPDRCRSGDRLASVTSVLDGSRSDLDAALTNLSTAVVDVNPVRGRQPQPDRRAGREAGRRRQEPQRQPDGTEEPAARGAQRHRQQLQHLRPGHPERLGGFALANFSNPLQVVCAAIRGDPERHRLGDRQAVLAVPRPGAAADQLQLPALSDQRLPG